MIKQKILQITWKSNVMLKKWLNRLTIDWLMLNFIRVELKSVWNNNKLQSKSKKKINSTKQKTLIHA